MSSMVPIAGWRNYAHRYSLHGVRCLACKKLYYPKRYVCTCGARLFEPYKFSGKGSLISFTRICNVPKQHVVCIVELDEGVRMFSRLVDVDYESLFPGAPLRAVFRKLFDGDKKDVISYGLVFTVDDSASE